MKKELDKKLVEKYPLIFRDRYAPATQTAMCWGFSCGDGWYNIIDTLCELLYANYNRAKNTYEFIKDKNGKKLWSVSKDLVTQEEIDEKRMVMEEEAKKIPIAIQVKEKYGGLRFYVNRATVEHYNYIAFAGRMSYHTCEECGAPGKLYIDGWHRTLCNIHAEMEDREDNTEE